MSSDPFALNLTINLLLLSVGMAMFIGSLFALIKKDGMGDIYKGRTVFLAIAGFIVSIWTILSL